MLLIEIDIIWNENVLPCTNITRAPFELQTVKRDGSVSNLLATKNGSFLFLSSPRECPHQVSTSLYLDMQALNITYAS